MVRGRPVNNLPLEFEWRDGVWAALFEKQAKFIQQYVLRALADRKFVMYLSCPISSRGGSYFATNVDIADFTAGQFAAEWGPRFWILNPARYQMESSHGLGLIYQHARELSLETGTTIDIERLAHEQPIGGGDYMRMWTKVLVEDGLSDLGTRIAAYYFLGPHDVRKFFARFGGADLTAGIEAYFAAKCATDPDFKRQFAPDEQADEVARRKAESDREAFFRFYSVRASVAFSKGSHDEWNIWQHVNRLRVATAGDAALGFGSQLPGYFEGRQIDPAASESTISAGYAIEAVIPVAEMTVETDPGRRVEPRGAVERGMGIHGGVIRRAVVMQSADEHAIVQMYETALEAFRREDLEGVLEHWAEDGAYLWPAVSPAIGKVEIRSAYIQFFTAWTAEERFMRHDLTVSGDLAYSRFGTELKLTPKAGGNASLMTLQGTHVYIRVDGHWRFKAVTAVAVPSS